MKNKRLAYCIRKLLSTANSRGIRLGDLCTVESLKDYLGADTYSSLLELDKHTKTKLLVPDDYGIQRLSMSWVTKDWDDLVDNLYTSSMFNKLKVSVGEIKNKRVVILEHKVGLIAQTKRCDIFI